MPDTEQIFLYGLAAIALVCFLWAVRLEIKLRRFVAGKDGKTLEDSILALKKEQGELKRFRADVEQYLTLVEARLARSLQGVTTVRFNAFKGTGSGGNQSFATAFLNEEGDGVVLSSLYGRERVGVFAKPIRKETSEYELTAEEREAIIAAKECLVRK
jgi:hypothetical protein